MNLKRSMTLLWVMMLIAGFSTVHAHDPLSPADRQRFLSSLTRAEKEWLASYETIRIAGPRAFPPFHYYESDGSLNGLAVDYIRLILDYLSIEPENSHEMPWPDVLKRIQTKEIDLISCIAKTEDREAYLIFTDPYLSFPLVITTRTEDKITDPEDLKGRIVAFVQGAAAQEWITRENIPVIPYFIKTPVEGLKSVSMGHADAHIDNLATAIYLIREHGLANLKIAAPLYKENYPLYIAVRKDLPELAVIINKALTALSPGQHAAIRNQWLAVDVESVMDTSTVVRWVMTVSGVAAVILALVLLWNRRLSREIRERKNAEETLQRLFDNTQDAIFIHDTAGRIRDVNARMCQMYGVTKQEACNLTIEMVSGAGMPLSELSTTWQKVLNGEKKVFEWEAVRPNEKTSFYVEVSLQKITFGQEDVVLANVRDITENRRSRAVNRLMFEISNSVLTTQSLDELYQSIHTALGQVMDVTNFFIAILDHGKSTLKFPYYVDTRDADLSGVRNFSQEDSLTGFVVSRRSPVLLDETELTARAEQKKIIGPVPLIWMGTPLMIGIEVVGVVALQSYTNPNMYSDQDLRVLSAVSDQMAMAIARKRTEQELQTQNRFIRTILDHLPIGLAVHTIDRGTATYMNRQFEEIYGWPGEKIADVEMFFENVYPDPEYREKIKRRILLDIQSGDITRMTWEGVEITGQNGQKKVITARNIPLFEQNLMISTVQDMTESTQLQSRLLQAQKIESVGRLAGGVAHDFNNMLTVILGYAQIALDSVDPSDPICPRLEGIMSAARRSSDLTRQLLTFARKQIIDPKTIDVNGTVEKMIRMLRRLIGEDIDLIWRPADQIWPVKMDPSQIDQLLANLCVNARDAVAADGRIIIETGKNSFDAAYCTKHPGVLAGDFVRLSVSDNGSGMDKHTQANLFEPFFTTKAAGKGTGLGLATVYGIVRQNNGFISVYSEPGQGSTFHIYLPRDVSLAEIEAAGPDIRAIPSGTETILVVEDEQVILDMVTVMLTELGYRVLAAAAPDTAMMLATESTEKIHLLLTDVVMPGMNGRNLSDWMIGQYPDIRCLFMSGYTADVIERRGFLDDGMNFIQKPFSMKDLAVTLREVLDSDPAAV